jgi:hypothetical protein
MTDAIVKSTAALAFGLHLLMAGCAARVDRMTPAERSERLAAERGRLPDLGDPAAKARSYLVISDILLRFAWEVVRDDELGDLEVLLGQYIAAVRGAREASPAGFRELEGALRRQLAILQDMSGQLTADARKPLEDIIAAVSSILELAQGTPRRRDLLR